MNNIDSMERLIYSFSKLPGVGRKTAERYAYRILELNTEDVELFSKSLLEAKNNIKICSVCGNFTENDICNICKSRKSDVICVVKEPKDIVAIEKARNVNYLYHVLHGTLNPMENKGPNDIRIKELLDRISKGGVSEVIMATNPDVEGEATAMYIATLLKPLGVKVTRLAHGIAVGQELEYADVSSLSRAILDRRKM